MKKRSLRSHIITTLIVMVVSVSVAGGPLFARKALATEDPIVAAARSSGGGGLPVMVTGNVPDQVGSALDGILTALTRAGVVAFFNAAQVFFGQLAYDAATALASGGKGQGALVYEKGFGDYMAGVAGDAAGSFIGSLSDDSFFQGLGVDLCAPSADKLLHIQLNFGAAMPSAPGMGGGVERPRPRCDFKDIVNNYEQLYTTLSNSEVTDFVSANFQPGGSDLSVSASIFGRGIGKISGEAAKKQLDRAETGAFKNVEGKVSGFLKTPASLVEQQTKTSLVEQPAQDQSRTRETILQNAFQEGAIQLAVYTASIFLNTLVNKLMERVFSQGLVGNLNISSGLTRPDAIAVAGKTDARKANVDLRDVQLVQTSDIELISELIACPTNRGTWNCAADAGLAKAIQTQSDQGNLTIKQALAEGMLHGDWHLLPKTFARKNLDPQCYTYAYCSGNLRKLRALRIFPVGFELAANSEANINRCGDVNGCVTLDEVVRGFSDCNATGDRDATHPWCKLIDPNWVVTSFAQQCQLTGYGETLLTNSLPQRVEECRDVQTCLQRNDKGECVGGYGYCVAEKNVYRFNADECPAQYASCRNFVSRAGETVSYLRNTVDQAICSADNVGCRAYATDRASDGTWIDGGKRIYLDAGVTPCAASGEGCTKLLAAEVGQSSLNLALNPSFEIVEGAGETAQSWSPPVGVVSTVDVGSSGEDGTASMKAPTGTEYTQTVTLVPGRIYTISFYARMGNAVDVDNRARVRVREYRADGTPVPAVELGRNFRSSGCDIGIASGGATSDELTQSWERSQCSFLAATSTASGVIEVRQTSGGGDALVDAVQLEESQFATNFVNGLNSRLPTLTMKVAPDEYACTGADTDNPACANFAQMCRQIDAGCQGYTNVNGGPEAPAILSTNDLCPASCVGYTEYRKGASAFDLVADADPRFSDDSDTAPDYFIAATGKQCSQQDVGCEVFTSIEGAAGGGETSSAFNYLRSCQLPNDHSETYFTWEGSEDGGFQLRTWSLMSEGGPGTAPRILAKRSPDGSFKEPTTCNEELWRSGLDPDCRQVYNGAGTVFYRYFSQTVLSTEDCTSWRLPHTTSDDCTKTGGAFNTGTGECVYLANIPSSQTCRAEFAGCRAYNGSSSGNILTVLHQDFRSAVAPFESGTQSPESLLVGDSSLRVDPTGAGVTETSVVIPDTVDDQLLRTSFWAKAPGRTDVVATISTLDPDTAGATPSAVGSVRIGTDWQRLDVGTFRPATGASNTRIIWTFTSDAGAAPRVFFDEVFVSRVTDVAYVVKDSWNTPAECDQSNAGVPEPQAMLGCQQYHDRFSNTVNAFRFTNLCREKAIGCRAFVDTRNSDAVGSETFVMGDATPVPVFNDASTTYASNTTVRLADRMLYMIYDQSKLCQPEEASCRAFGKPTYSVDRSGVDSFETVYLKDDVTKYGDMLCRPSEEFCDAFSYNGSPNYFRNPDDHVCEYKSSVRLSGTSFTAPDPLAALPAEEIIYSGWFRKTADGSDYPCYPENLEGGTFFNLSRRGDTNYSAWVGMCPQEQGECTEFRDPNDTSDPLYRASGRPYFFLQNDKLDQTSCAGNVNVGEGCILLRDQSNTSLNYSVAASYRAYEQNDFNPTPAVNCAETPSSEACMAVGSTSTDANVLLKVKIDRDCSQWLGCKSAESVYDPATRKFKDICTDLALCDKSTQIPGDIFCAHYVDRQSGTEPIMSQGKFFDIHAYTSRPVGLGASDYSGYAIPNAFQISDLVSTRVGADGANDVANNTFRYAQDYRLAAEVMIPVTPGAIPGVASTTGDVLDNQAYVLDAQAIGLANPRLKLCQNKGTGLVGYYVQSERDIASRAASLSEAAPQTFPCYLPVRNDIGDVNFQELSQKFSLDDPKTDRILSNAFPVPECRAYPEADSPYAGSLVTEWDFTTVPPKPLKIAEGFASANTCEFGEDCACTYKRADYQGVDSKFFSTLSQNVPPGICVGGPRAGQSCLPSAIFDIGTSNGLTSPASETLVNGVLSANASQTCGPPLSGGTCIAFSKLEIVRGVFGQCLERDTTRMLGADLSSQPCLTWNPTPILFGNKDPFHYQPTAGYLSPQNSGQYYCASAVKKPASYVITPEEFKRFNGSVPADDPASLDSFSSSLDAGASAGFSVLFGGPLFSYTDSYHDWENQFRIQNDPPAYYVGKMTRMDFDEQWVSTGNRCWPKECNLVSPSIIGHSAARDKGVTAKRCEKADKSTRDLSAVRLVDAGKGYSETFYRINDDKMSTLLGATGTIDRVNRLNDNTISYFKINPIENGEAGHLACGYQEEWVDNMPSTDYGNKDSLKTGERFWRQEFFRNYNPYMTRGNEAVLELADGSPAATRCVSDTPTSTQCNFKTWETDYRSAGKDKQFYGIFNDTTRTATTRSFMNIRETPIIGTCDDSKPYFSIRAVFQTPAADDPTVEPTGPWQFVGFWVSACGGDTGGDQRYIYMNIEMGSVSVCNQLAEVKSAASNTDAAFTDRIWQNSGFREPGTGIQYSARSSPFSSALNTGPAGKDPLFQAGFELAGFSPLNPPTFLQAGDQTFYRDRPVPNDKYQYLTNLFARIYRVYRFHLQPVLSDGTACLEGPFKGIACTLDDGSSIGPDGDGSSARCAVDGQCDAALLSATDQFDIRVCNRSVNHNILCGTNSTVCQAPSFADAYTGKVTSLRNDCVEDPASAGDFYCGTTKGWNIGHRGNDTLTVQPTCSFLAENSEECPVDIHGDCSGTDGSGGRICEFNDSKDQSAFVASGIDFGAPTLVGGTFISCTTDADCRFTANNYSGSDDQKSQCVLGAELPGITGPDGFGRCRGGIRENALCRTKTFGDGSYLGCGVDMANETAFEDSCGPVSTASGDPVSRCISPDTSARASTNPDEDNNICTNSIGYVPRLDLCPNPADEYCGLIAYKVSGGLSQESLDPHGHYPAPTDVTMGHFTPYFAGWTGSSDPNLFSYLSYYNPRPPRVAAPDTRNCPVPGQCPISKLDAFTFNGQGEGVIHAGGGQQKSSLRFYAWAEHNQMPLRQLLIDWGDKAIVRIDDAKLKNRKPFCSVLRECSDPIKGEGLTCETDSDCPPGAGQCLPLGTCNANPARTCRRDADCSTGGVEDTCRIRTMFGNSGEACQADYFDFTHIYSCGAIERAALPDCSAGTPEQNRCSGNPELVCDTNANCPIGDECLPGLAPTNGCFDTASNSCRFTPKLMLEDNWGWCTGECRLSELAGSPTDAADASVRHTYGGCYSGAVLGRNVKDSNIRFNTRSDQSASESTGRDTLHYVVGDSSLLNGNGECSTNLPVGSTTVLSSSALTNQMKLRPWITYPGSIEIRYSGEAIIP